MTEKTKKLVYNTRIIIYTAMMGALLILGTQAILKGHEEINDTEAFWPPDMVPHPTLPEPANDDDRLS